MRQPLKGTTETGTNVRVNEEFEFAVQTLRHLAENAESEAVQAKAAADLGRLLAKRVQPQPEPAEKPNEEPEAITPAPLEDLLREVVLMVTTAISAGTLRRETVREQLAPLLTALEEGEKPAAP